MTGPFNYAHCIRVIEIYDTEEVSVIIFAICDNCGII